MMVFEKEDIRRIRTKICQLYQDKRIIVAPCRCKLYMSKSSQIIDQEGKTSCNWVYFATGVTSLIYDHDAKKLMMTLFDVDSLRLLWMLKLNTCSTVQSPTSCFHVVSTRDDRSEHAGLLYESKEVASLLLNTFLLLANRRVPNSQRKESYECNSRPTSIIINDRTSANYDSTPQNQKKRRSKLFRSFSFHGRKSGSNVGAKSETQPRRLRSKTLGPEHFKQLGDVSKNLTRRGSTPDCRRSSGKEEEFRTELNEGQEDISISSSETSRVSTGLIKQKILSRRNADSRSSFRLKQADSSQEVNTAQQCDKRAKTSGLFKRRKVCRTLSEKLPSKPQDITEGCGSDHDSVVRNKKSQPKPRSRSDSLLVRGSVVNCIVETGHMAKYLRHRKQWIRSLESGNVNETDLCVTDL